MQVWNTLYVLNVLQAAESNRELSQVMQVVQQTVTWLSGAKDNPNASAEEAPQVGARRGT